MKPSWTRSGVDRAAILLLALGEQDAAQVLQASGRQGRAARRRRHGPAVSGVSREEVSTVLTTFSTNVEQQTSFGVGTDEYIRKVLNEALGADKAGGVIDRILRGRSSRGLEALKWMEPQARSATCCATSTRRSSRSCCPTSTRIRRRRC